MGYPIKENEPKVNRAALIASAVLVIGLPLIGMISDIVPKKNTKPVGGPIGELGYKINPTNEVKTLHKKPGEFGMNQLPYERSASSNGKYPYSLEVIYVAEDPEFWEIEQVDGNYYRVRREDHDPGMVGPDEFDVEEPIGDIKALYDYAKSRYGYKY